MSAIAPATPRFHEATLSLCPVCMKRVQGRFEIDCNQVFLKRFCPDCGTLSTLYEEDAHYHLQRRDYDKTGTLSEIQTTVSKGCPYDCGLCPAHDQHSCIGLIEVTQACDLGCPLCYAQSGQGNKPQHLSLEKIEAMIDFWLATEGGQGEILQISGGEPTLHPQILEILELARSKPISHIMLNTHGLRLLTDEAFCERLGQLRGGFELYLQFDGWNADAMKTLRGRDLTDEKKGILAAIEKYKIPTTLVMTVEEGVNDHLIGESVVAAMNMPYIRGINLQPSARFGRMPEPSFTQKPALSLTGVLNRLSTQSGGLITTKDFIPLPCNVERIAVSYFFRQKGEFVSLTRHADIKSYLPIIQNTLNFKAEDFAKELSGKFAKGDLWCDCFNFIKEAQKILPTGLFNPSKAKRMETLDQDTFRITVTSFVDRTNFDLKSAQKECVHVITEDEKRIPFSMYNLLYRNQP